MSIIAVLTGIAIGAGRHAVESGKFARARAELATLSIALDAYRRVHGDCPRTDDSAALLQALLGRRGPAGVPIDGPTLIDPGRFAVSAASDPFADVSAQLLDPWGQPYRYAYKSQSPWTNSSFLLWSVGPDAADSGTLLVGGYADRDASANLDNIYANE